MNNLMMILLNSSSDSNIENCTSWKIQYQGSSYTSFYVEFQDEIIIDWGDGNIETFNNYGNNYDTEISHFYDYVPETTQFIVKIFGHHTRVRFNDGQMKSYIIEAISCASSLNNYAQMFQHCQALKVIAKTFFINGNLEDYQTNCTSMFSQSGIQQINHNIFKNVTTPCNCFNMFYNCPNLVNVSNLEIPNESTTMSMFDSCFNLYNVDGESLVRKWTTGHVGSHEYMFYNCYNMVGNFVEYYWWAQFDGGPVNWYSFSYTGMFYNCISLINYYDIPDDWK